MKGKAHHSILRSTFQWVFKDSSPLLCRNIFRARSIPRVLLSHTTATHIIRGPLPNITSWPFLNTRGKKLDEYFVRGARNLTSSSHRRHAATRQHQQTVSRYADPGSYPCTLRAKSQNPPPSQPHLRCTYLIASLCLSSLHPPRLSSRNLTGNA
jgi:hypothetical protein